MHKSIIQLNQLFNATLNATNPATPQQPITPQHIELTAEDKAFFVWLARHG